MRLERSSRVRQAVAWKLGGRRTSAYTTSLQRQATGNLTNCRNNILVVVTVAWRLKAALARMQASTRPGSRRSSALTNERSAIFPQEGPPSGTDFGGEVSRAARQQRVSAQAENHSRKLNKSPVIARV